MDRPSRYSPLKRQQQSIVIHFDYDAFYASCFEAETPSLRSRPLAVQQKHIVVTCNYEARRRGLHKLQLISEAKRICPDVVVVLGEDLTRFRNVSKELYAFLKSFSWNKKCERLGFDEVWLDVTDIVDYNIALLNHGNLADSFFCLSKNDPAVGFSFDASKLAGKTYPKSDIAGNSEDAEVMGSGNDDANLSGISGPSDPKADFSDDALEDSLRLRLYLGSHLARYVRDKLHSEKGFTCAAGVSTNKLLSKLVGNVHKPNDQTTLLSRDDGWRGGGGDNVIPFIDGHEVGKIPGIGFKLAQQLKAHVLRKTAEVDGNETIGSGAKEEVSVGQVRQFFLQSQESSGVRAEHILEKILVGPGTPHGHGARIWGLLNGRDDSEVAQARDIPRQISIEDSYGRLDTWDQARKELSTLSKSLLERMHEDLLGYDSDEYNSNDDHDDKHTEDHGRPHYDIKKKGSSTARTRRWVAFPKTLRLSTRPRPPQNPDGSVNRSFARISRSAPMPSFVFSFKENTDALAERLVKGTLLALFKRLHPQKSGWNLSLINVAATNIVDAASDKEGGVGRDISKMFKRQGTALKPWDPWTANEASGGDETPTGTEAKCVQKNQATDPTSQSGGEPIDLDTTALSSFGPTNPPHQDSSRGSEDLLTASQAENLRPDDNDDDMYERWGSGGDDDIKADEDSYMYSCDECGAGMPIFAMGAHARWHAPRDV